MSGLTKGASSPAIPGGQSSSRTSPLYKRTAGVFLDTLSDIAYKKIKKNGAFCLARFWQTRKAEEEGAHGL
jgi:hypothetical protein